MERKILAVLTVDEGVALRNAETNGVPNDGTLDYVQREFGWLDQSGIRLDNAFISDEDDTESWGRYIDTIIRWMFEHSWEDEGRPRLCALEELSDIIETFKNEVKESEI